jgi:phage tail-like protein
MKKLGILLAAVLFAAGIAALVGDIEWRPPGLHAQAGGGGALSFVVEIDGVPTSSFRSVDGLSMDVEVVDITSAEDNIVRKRPGRVKYGDITLKKGYIAGSNELFDWISQAAAGKLERKSMSIALRDERGSEIQRWNCFECFPKSWHGPVSVGERAGVAIEKIEIAVEKVERAR